MPLPKKPPMSGISFKNHLRQVVDDENPLIPDDSGVLEAVKLQEDVEIISVDILEEGAGAPSEDTDSLPDNVPKDKDIENSETLSMTPKPEEKTEKEGSEESSYSELISKAKFVKANEKSWNRSDAGVITVVNSVKNGKRLVISEPLIKRLGNPPSLAVGITDEGIVLLPKSDNVEMMHLLRVQGKKYIIYSVKLVEEITDTFLLDFSGRVSMTFLSVTYLESNDQEIAMIPIKK